MKKLLFSVKSVAALAVLSTTLVAARLRFEESGIPIPVNVNESGQIVFNNDTFGFADVKVAVNTKNGKTNAAARGNVVNLSNSVVKEKNNPVIEEVSEDLIEDFVDINAEITKSNVKVQINGDFTAKASGRIGELK